MFVYYHVTAKKEKVDHVIDIARKYTKNIKYIKSRNEGDVEFLFRICYGMHLIFEHDIKIVEKCGIQVRIEKI